MGHARNEVSMNEEKYCYEERSDIPVYHAVNRHARAVSAFLCAVGAVILTLASATVGAVLGAAGERRNQNEKTNVIFYQGNDFSAQLENKDGSFTKAGVADFVKKSVVEVSATPRNATVKTVKAQVASGLVVSADGYIVTDCSVVEDAEDIRVRVNAADKPVPALLHAMDIGDSLAVLKVQVSGLTPVCFGNSDNLEMGQEVLAVGMTDGNGWIARDGIVSVPQFPMQVFAGINRSAIRTTANLGEFCHGGGLFNMEGQLVGFFSESFDSENKGMYARPVNGIRGSIKDLIEKKYVSGRVNTAMVSLWEYETESEWLPVGVYVCAVNASACPLQKGDVILAVNDNRVDGMKQWTKILNCYQVGEEVAVIVKRDGNVVVLKIILEEMEK